MELKETKDGVAPKVLLIGLDTGAFDSEISLNELTELAQSAGAEVVARMSQRRPSPDPATVIGQGKLEEAGEFCENNEIELTVFDCELSPSQMRNIEKVLKTNVIDRTALILDIFARRAVSAEGKLQVELAQLQYRLPRLSGLGVALSRLGGGIGTRGPGETQLETDRRHIRRRIAALKEQLAELEKRRSLHRERRRKDGATVIAIVGYTNVGKSTLLNALTQAGVLAENRLFATLDLTSRALELPDGRSVLIVDTVGFVRRLPHQLVEAFHSTLEEAADADLIWCVCDASSSESEEQYEVAKKLMEDLGVTAPILTVINKCDLTPPAPGGYFGEKVVSISAANGTGFTALLEKTAESLTPMHQRLILLIPYDQTGLISEILQEGKIFSTEYELEGTKIDALVARKILYKVADYAQPLAQKN